MAKLLSRNRELDEKLHTITRLASQFTVTVSQLYSSRHDAPLEDVLSENTGDTHLSRQVINPRLVGIVDECLGNWLDEIESIPGLRCGAVAQR